MSITVTYTNCIGAGHTGGGDFSDAAGGSTVTRTYSISSDTSVGAGTGNQTSKSAASLFTAPGSGDLTLAASSPARLTGTDLSGSFTNDILGVNRPAGRWDVGAHQASSASGGGGGGAGSSMLLMGVD